MAVTKKQPNLVPYIDSFFRKISNTKLTYSRLTTMNELLDYTISNPNRKII